MKGKKKMKTTMKAMMTMGVALCCGMCLAGHGGPGGGHGGPGGGHGGFGGPGRGGAPMMHGGGGFHGGPGGGHHGGGSFWGRGGRNFWPGFVGGVVGGLVYDAITPAPVVYSTPTVYTTPAVVSTPVVTTPVYTTQNVWVEGRYVDQIQPNGTVIRVWQPGHYEQRTVVVQ